jgi:hypothetical protein
VIKIAPGESVLPYVQILAQKGAGGSTGPTGPKGHVIPGQSQGGGPMRLAGISTLGDAPTSLLPLWDLNACTIKLDAAAFDAAGVYDPLKLAQAYGIPLQGPGGLNQAQVGTTMVPATYFQPGAILKMPKAACDMAKAQQAAQNPPAANPPATTTPPDPTHGADPTTPAESTASKGLSTGAMVGIGVAAAAAIGGGYLLLRKKGKGKRK